MHVWGWTGENNAGRSKGQMRAWPAIKTHLSNEGKYQAPHGRQPGNHSQAVESSGIQMHV